MRLPAVLHDSYSEVLPRVRKAITLVRKGAAWDDAFAADQTIDTVEVPGLLALSGPSPLLGADPHFQCYLPLNTLMRAVDAGRIPREKEDGIFMDSLRADWGLLGLISPPNLMWLYPESRRWPFLDAIQPRWEGLVAEGARYSLGSTVGEQLWALPTNLKFVLSNLGVPPDQLNDPQGGSRLLQLIHQRKRPA